MLALVEKLIRQIRSLLGLNQDRGEPIEAAAPTPPPSLGSLASDTDALIKIEVNDGCTLEVERRVKELRRLILRDAVVYEGTEAEHQALDWLWVSMLRLGLFSELLHLVRRFDLPLRPEVKTFSEFCERQYEENRRRGEAYRARHPDEDIFTMGCIVWGAEYVGNFLKYNLRSMLSPGNVPALRTQGRLVMSIVTDADGERRMREHPVFHELARYADVEFTLIPPELIGILRQGHLVQHFYILYGMLDHCSIYFAQGARSHLFMIPVDAIVADGSLNNMANYRRLGYECCGGGNIVAETETFLPALDSRFGDEGAILISTEDLATLAVEHAHHYFRSQVLASENVDFGKHPRELFWPVEGGGRDPLRVHPSAVHQCLGPREVQSKALRQRRLRHDSAHVLEPGDDQGHGPATGLREQLHRRGTTLRDDRWTVHRR